MSYSRFMFALRLPSLGLAAALQLMPMVRAALPVTQTAASVFAIIFRWGAAATAALGGIQAVSGASTVITTPLNQTATNGVPLGTSQIRLITAPQQAGYWAATGLPPGLSLSGVNGSSSWKIVGTPTAAGIFSVGLTAKSSQNANSSETTTATMIITILQGGGGGNNSPPVATAQSVTTAEDTAKAITLSGTDPDNNPLTYAIVTSPAHGTLAGTPPNVTYTPTANYNGADSFTFRVNDGTTNSAPATVSITITAVNDAPVANAQSISTTQNVSAVITLTGSDVEGSPLTYTVVAQPAHGTLSGTAPNLTYAPATGYSGTDNFTFRVNDGSSNSTLATVSLTVAAAFNNPPVATAQSVTATEDTANAITLAGTDAEGSPLTYAIVAAPAHGALSGTAPNFTYTPAANYSGSDSFTFKVNDGALDSAAALVSIAITAVNDAPVANAQSVTTAEDTSKAIALTGTDVEGSALTYAVVTAPTHGTLTGTAPNLTYTPAANYNGGDSFTFKANDGALDSAVATVSITITAVNDAPVANAQSPSTPEDTATAVVLIGSDAEGSALTYSVVTGPAHGALSGTAPNLIYTPAANYNGGDSFTFKVNDGALDSATAAVSINITPVNDAPTAIAQAVSTPKNTAQAITFGGSDIDGNALTYSIITQPAHGTLTGTAPNVTYTPVTDYVGADSFTFKVNDGLVDSPAAAVAITVTSGPNTPPIANAQSVTTAEDTAVSVTLTGSDADSDPLSYTVVTQPAHGALTGTAPNLSYTPAANYNGGDSFTFRVNDGTVNSASATVSITVTAVNDAPVANAQSVTTTEDTAKAITLGGTDTDGDPLTFTVASQPSKGVLSGTAPNLTYTPLANTNGTDSFTFTVNDGLTNSTTATVSITITPVNDPPVANAQSLTTAEDTAKVITLSGNDVEGSPLTYAIVTAPAHGSIAGAAPNITYTPAANYNGADSFTFKVNDGALDSAAATVSLTVTAVNDAPIANAQNLSTPENTSKAIALTGSDVEGSPLTFAIVTPPVHGALTGVEPNVTYTPDANYHGADSFTFKVNDGSVDSAVATVSININSVNAVPVATAQSVTTAEDTAKAVTLSGTDADGDTLTYAIVSQPAHGLLSGAAPNVNYAPFANYSGADSFTFRVNDGTTSSAPATVSITVTPVNDSPVANAQAVTIGNGAATAVTLTGSDVDGDALSFTTLTSPAHGELTGTAPNLLFTPQAGYTGGDSFAFNVNDGQVSSAAATVTLSITSSTTNPVVTVAVTDDALEGGQAGTFQFTRTGDTSLPLAVSFTVGGTASTNDFSPIIPTASFAAGASTASISINPIDDTAFEGPETVVITLTGSAAYTVGNPGSAALTIYDDDQPALHIAAIQQNPLRLEITAGAVPGKTLILQSSTDLSNWTVVSAPPLNQGVDFLVNDPANAPYRHYRLLCVDGAATAQSIAEALAQETFGANIVGFVNAQAESGWSLAANPLVGDADSGLVSSVPYGTIFLSYGGKEANTFGKNGWSQDQDRPLTDPTVSGWLYNPNPGPLKLTFVGELPDPTDDAYLPEGWSVRSSPMDVSSVGDELLGVQAEPGDVVFEYGQSGQGNYAWTAHLRSGLSWNGPLAMQAGEGVLIYRTVPSVKKSPSPPKLKKLQKIAKKALKELQKAEEGD